MSDFLKLPEESPAAPLMASLVHACDMLVEHEQVLGPETSERLKRALCIGAHLVMQSQCASLDATRTTIETAARQ